jgi:transcriptional regulator with XRE-family HTH domain
MHVDSKPRSTIEVDKYIGAQMRVRRTALRMSQEALAAAIGVTFQQIQKYEKGVNRVSAATLFQIAQVLRTEASALMPMGEGPSADPLLSVEFTSALGQPLSRLNVDGRSLLVAIAQALATQPRLLL